MIQLIVELNEWYKDSIEGHREMPPAGLWNAIENELDVADVWANIELKLDKRAAPSLPIWRWAAVAASLLILITLAQPTADNYVAEGFYTSTTNSDRSALELKTNVVTADATAFVADAKKTRTISQKKKVRHEGSDSDFIIPQAELKIDANRIAALLSDAGVTAGDNTSHRTDASVISTRLLPVTDYKIFAHTQGRGMHYLARMDELASLNTYNAVPLLKRFSFGAIGSYNNTWLVQTQRIDGAGKDLGVESVAGTGKNIGIVSTMDLFKNLGFQIEFLRSETKSNQNMIDIFSDRHVPDELLAHSISLNVLMVHKRESFLRDFPASHNFITGIGLNYLLSARQFNGFEMVDIRSKYRRESASLELGYEYELSPLKHWSVSAGARANIGLNNLEQDRYSRTQTKMYSWGAHIAIRYVLFDK